MNLGSKEYSVMEYEYDVTPDGLVVNYHKR